MMPPAYMQFRDELIGILDTRYYTADWLDCQVQNFAIRYLATETAIILFKFERYPTGFVELQGMAAAGDLGSIKDELIPAAEELAKGMGCSGAEISSRAAWAKLLPDYEMHQVTIKKVF